MIFEYYDSKNWRHVIDTKDVKAFGIREGHDLTVWKFEKQGKWIQESKDGIASGWCSNCMWIAKSNQTAVIGMNFCPRCGADMRGGNK